MEEISIISQLFFFFQSHALWFFGIRFGTMKWEIITLQIIFNPILRNSEILTGWRSEPIRERDFKLVPRRDNNDLTIAVSNFRLSSKSITGGSLKPRTDRPVRHRVVKT